jgi:putative NADH-flavin reductase
MKFVIFGANGPTGRLATARALAARRSVVAVIRQPREFPIQGRELTVVGADVLDTAAVGDAVAGADTVVSALGVSNNELDWTVVRPSGLFDLHPRCYR